MTDLNSSLVAEAVRVWTEFGREMSPKRDDDRVVRHFGVAVAYELLPLLKGLEDDFYFSDAHLRADGVAQMGQLAKDDFRKRHPLISEEVTAAFAWCYTFDFK